MIQEAGFHLKLTSLDESAQNGLAENPYKSLTQMTRCMLYSAELGPEYWSFVYYTLYISKIESYILVLIRHRMVLEDSLDTLLQKRT